MNKQTQQWTIDQLVDDLRPVTPIRPRSAVTIALAATAAAAVMVALGPGLRADIIDANPAPIVVMRSLALLLLGFACLHAMAASARPGVGASVHGWQWLLAGLTIFPLWAAISAVQGRPVVAVVLQSPSAAWCLGTSIGAALLIGGLLTAWLRRAATVNAARSAWLVGLAAGALGTFCYSLACTSTSIEYIGIWYSSAIAISAGLARVAVPPLLRW